MNRKIIAGITLGLLFIAFGCVSILVVLTKRHPYFVGKKLRLGALLLSISGVSMGCPSTTCYVTAPPNNIHVDQAISLNEPIVISKANSDTITGKITERTGTTFSYALFDSSDTLILKDNIEPIDGSYDEDSEEFKIDFGQAILPGNYNLKFYNEPKDSIKNSNWYVESFDLTVTE